MDAITYYSSPDIVTPQAYFDWDYIDDNSLPVPRFIIENSRTVSRMKKMFDNGTVVDLGCGPGTSLQHLTKVFSFKKCVGIDAVPSMLSFMVEHKNGLSYNLETQCRDLRKDSFGVRSNSVDLVICCNVLKYLKSIDHLFSETVRILKPNRFFGFDLTTHMESRRKIITQDDKDGTPVMYRYHQKHLEGLLKKHSFSVVSEKTEETWIGQEDGVVYNKKIVLAEKL